MAKIYILCPANVQTGGTEVLHQLADHFNNIGKDCYIVFYEKNKCVKADIPEAFKQYNIKLADSVNDSKDDYLIIPEVCLYFSKQFSNIKMIFYWLSFDNYFGNSGLWDFIRYYFKGMFSIRNILGKLYRYNSTLSLSFNKIKKIDSDRVLHAYQSKYVSDILHKNGINNQLPLRDYINTKFTTNIDNNSERKDIILYNPAKGFKITKKLIEIMPEVEFIPLKGLNREQLSNLFQTAKVYIDFGNHPGKDKIPREACSNGCCVIVGKNGSAAYFEDVPISDKYKFHNSEIHKVKDIILDIFKNYIQHSKQFDAYRDRIKQEKDVFYADIERLIPLYFRDKDY